MSVRKIEQSYGYCFGLCSSVTSFCKIHGEYPWNKVRNHSQKFTITKPVKVEVRSSFVNTWDQSPRLHHKGATGRVRTGDQQYPTLCHCQLGQDIPSLMNKVRIATVVAPFLKAVAASSDCRICSWFGNVMFLTVAILWQSDPPKLCPGCQIAAPRAQPLILQSKPCLLE